MIELDLLRKGFPSLDRDVLVEFSKNAIVKEIAQGVEIMREGQHVKMVPFVVEGLVKVFSRHEDKELLLYYIRPRESCIMSFIAGLKDQPSKIFAITEEKSTLVLVPSHFLEKWMKDFPHFNMMFYDLYNLRYADMLDTIHHLVFEKLDQRILEYLKMKLSVTGGSSLDIRHREIASEMGTSREVVTRVLRKLEKEGKISQQEGKIRLL
jgi:CRP/FNR family transcriptional regulator, anaerobic regulatory protein